MKYKKELKSKDFAMALGLNNDQVKRLTDACQKAYNQHWNHAGPNIDQINYVVAPYIKTPEEAFWVAMTIMIDVNGAMMSLMMKGN